MIPKPLPPAMPYVDPEKRRKSNRDSMRRKRARAAGDGWQTVKLPPALARRLDALREAERELLRRETAEGEPDPALPTRRAMIADMVENSGWVLEAVESGECFDRWAAEHDYETLRAIAEAGGSREWLAQRWPDVRINLDAVPDLRPVDGA